MRVFVIKAGEPVPAPGHPARWARSGLLARALVARGHAVTWIVSTFDHVAKRQVFPADTVMEAEPGIQLVALHAPSYRSHRSFRRLWHHAILDQKLDGWLSRASRPDVIVAALPIPELAATAVRYGSRWGVPVIVDCRDMWPDLFLEGRGPLARGVMRVLTWPMSRATRQAWRDAAAITGHTDAFVRWGLRQAERAAGPWDVAFPLAYPSAAPLSNERAEAGQVLDALGVSSQRGVFRLAFVGTMTRHFALEQCILAAKQLHRSGAAIEMVFCGDGDRLPELRRLAGGNPAIRFLGWQPGHVVWELMRRADAGLAPYASSDSFEQSIPNKIVEYFSAGLPVVTSIAGLSRELVTREGTGWLYAASDPGELVALLTRLAADRPEVERAGRAAQALFLKAYRAEDVYDRFAQHVERVAGRATSPTGVEEGSR